MEIWDAYNENGKPVGCDLIRGEDVPDGLFHLVSEIIVRHTDGSFLAMQRDYSKKNYGGFWEDSAGGSVLKGENSFDGAVRELFEETGICCNKLKKIYNILGEEYPCIYCGYVCTVDCDKNTVKLQKGETVAYKWVEKRNIIDFVTAQDYVSLQKERALPYIFSVADTAVRPLSSLIGSLINVTVDRPYGSVHPKHSDIVYNVNYGYVKGIFAPDGEEQDVYILGVSVPIKEFTGRIIAVIHRKDDVEDKWVTAPKNLKFTKSEILELTNFQEQYFDIEIIM